MFGDEARTDFGVFFGTRVTIFTEKVDVLQHVAEVRERKKLVESHIAAVDARRCKGTKISGDFEGFCFGVGLSTTSWGGVGWGDGLGQ